MVKAVKISWIALSYHVCWPKDDQHLMVEAFSSCLEARRSKTWYNGINKSSKEDWGSLKEAFSLEFFHKESMEDVWKRLQHLRQEAETTYQAYEGRFLELLTQLNALFGEGVCIPHSLVKEAFLNGLSPKLQYKVKTKFPATFEEALQVARIKQKRLMYSLGMEEEYSLREVAKPYVVKARDNSLVGTIHMVNEVQLSLNKEEECVVETALQENHEESHDEDRGASVKRDPWKKLPLWNNFFTAIMR